MDLVAERYHVNISTWKLQLFIITEPHISIHDDLHRKKIADTLTLLRPTFFLIDPLVRVDHCDENNAKEMSGLLSYFRRIQREFETSIMITHHASKRSYGRPGERLRGSSVYAFADTIAFIEPKDGNFLLSIEHRANKSPDPISLNLVSENGLTSLDVISDIKTNSGIFGKSLDGKIIEELKKQKKPITRFNLRERLNANSEYERCGGF